jgi:hypothetical protein
MSEGIVVRSISALLDHAGNFGGSPVFVIACVVEALVDLLLRG